MKIYLAGSFVDQKALREESHKLWKLGHEIVSSWLNETAKSPHLLDEQHKRKVALNDLVEVGQADLIVLDNRRSSGGKNTEWGAGLFSFQHKLLYLIGKPSSVFHELADLKFKNWNELVKFMGRKKK